MNSKSIPPTLNSGEAAAYLGMSESWLRQSRMVDAVVTEGPPYVKIGRAVRYLRRDLDLWLESRRVERS